jgi:predicted DNA binding CopG/RHH family protein
MCHECFKFAANMTEEKVDIRIRVKEDFYDIIAKTALRKGLTVPAFTRYVLKKYFNDAKKTNTNP